MKKIIVGVVGIMLLAGGVAFFLFFKQSDKPVVIESVLPAQPIFYMRVANLSARIEKFTMTKLFQDLKDIDYKKLAGILNVPPQDLDEVQQKFNNLFTAENQRMLNALFGREIALAFYNADNLKDLQANSSTETQKVITEIAGNFFIVTRVSADVVAAEAVLKLAGQFSKDLKTETKHYNGKDITLISPKDSTLALAYVRFNDILVMGLGEKAAQSAIDVLSKKKQSLIIDKDFIKRAASFDANVDTVGYLDVKTVYALVQEHLGQLAKAPQSAMYANQLTEQLKQTQGLETLVFTNQTGDVLTAEANLYFDKDKLDPAMSAFYGCPADDNRSANFVPWDALFYEWSNCLDFPLMWNQYKQQVAMQGKASGKPLDLDQMIGVYEKMLGLSMDGEILPVLGKEFGLYSTDVDFTGNFPVPKLVAFLQVTSREKMTALINKLLALQPNLSPVEEMYNEQVIRYIPIPLADNFQIGYTFIDNYFLLASNVDILKASLDAAKNPDKSILINASLPSAASKKNSLFYIQLDRLFAKASQLIEWSVKMANESKFQRNAFITGSQKNLDDIKKKDQDLSATIAKKKISLAQITAMPQPTVETDSQKEVLEKELAGAQKELAANQERAKEISAQMEAYANKTPKDDENLLKMEQIAKPTLKALSNIRYFSTVNINGSGVLQSTIHLKID